MRSNGIFLYLVSKLLFIYFRGISFILYSQRWNLILFKIRKYSTLVRGSWAEAPFLFKYPEIRVYGEKFHPWQYKLIFTARLLFLKVKFWYDVTAVVLARLLYHIPFYVMKKFSLLLYVPFIFSLYKVLYNILLSLYLFSTAISYCFFFQMHLFSPCKVIFPTSTTQYIYISAAKSGFSSSNLLFVILVSNSHKIIVIYPFVIC